MGFNRFAVWRKGMPSQSRIGEGWAANLLSTSQTADSDQSIAVSTILGGLYLRSGLTAGRTDTSGTAANILAACPDMDIGDSFVFTVSNTSAQTLTLAGGTGVTASGNLTVPTLTRRDFVFTKTSSTAMTMVGL